jgi:hypothetical protein
VPEAMKISAHLLLAAGAGVIIGTPASAMPVSTFLTKVDQLAKEGAMATATSDAALLKKELQDDAAALRSERLAATQIGKTPPYCPGGDVAQPTLQEIVSGLKSVPEAKSGTTEVKDALRAFMAKRFPCTR